MKLLPNYEHAILSIEKLSDYSLNSEHYKGRYKARLFELVLGIHQHDAEMLKGLILENLHRFAVNNTEKTKFGEKFVVDMDIHIYEKIGRIRTGWILLVNHTRPQLITCYIIR